MEGLTSAEDTAEGAQENEDDFFSTWDQPASAKPAAKASSSKSIPAPPPSIGKALSPSSASGSTVAQPQPQRLTSSSLRGNSVSNTPPSSQPTTPRPAKLGATRTGSSSTGGSKAGKLGLGAKKATAPINFEEAERRAKEEDERVKQAMLDGQKAEEEAKIAAEAARSNAPMSPKMTKGSTTLPDAKRMSGDMDRLGMGFKKLGVGASATAAASSAKRYPLCTHTSKLSDVHDYLALRPSTTPTMPETNLAAKRPSRQTCILVAMRTTPQPSQKPKAGCRTSRVLRVYLQINTLDERRRKARKAKDRLIERDLEVVTRVIRLQPRKLQLGMPYRELWTIPTYRTLQIV